MNRRIVLPLLSLIGSAMPLAVQAAAFSSIADVVDKACYLVKILFTGAIILTVVFVLLANLSAGRTGRRWRAVRDNEVAAELAGIDLGRARVSAFMVSAAAAGAAGAILAFTVKLAAPSAFTLTLSLTLLAAIVLSMSILIFGLGAAALLRAAHEEVANVPTRRVMPEPVLTMRPHPAARIPGTKAWAKSRIGSTLTACTARHSSIVTWSMSVKGKIAALLTRMSQRP